MAELNTHIGIPLATDRSTCSLGAPRWNSVSGLTTMAWLACRIPRVRLVHACCKPSAVPPGCKKSAAPRSTGVQLRPIGLSPPSSCSASLPMPIAAAGPVAASACSHKKEFRYSNADCVPTKIHSVRSMLSTVTCFKNDTSPRRIVHEMRCGSSPVRYCFSGSSTILANPSPMFAKDRSGVTPIKDRRTCARLRSVLHALTTWAVTWLSPTTPLTVTPWKAI
mmetsp:Transcript_77505/g.219154  ORF Transcript_77505/g.219154 Transcript_77505/m.219154 type:complete len:222 (+) Transcript_77505:152-817(+)